MEAELKRIERTLQALQGNNPFSFDMYKTQLTVWHIPMPPLRQIVTDGLFSSLSQLREIKLWRFVWQNTQVIEVRLAVLIRIKKALFTQPDVLWEQLQWFAEGIENWCESDFISEMIASVFEQATDDSVEKVLHQWNKSSNPWLQRQSIVSLFYYQRLRKSYPRFSLIKQQVEPLVTHEFWYVQRAVGWTLRESLQVYPEKTLQLIKKHIAILPAIAWSTVLEKCSTDEKNELKALRKKALQIRRKTTY